MREINRPAGLALVKRGIYRRCVRPILCLGPREFFRFFWNASDNSTMLRSMSKRLRIEYHEQTFELDLGYADRMAGEGVGSFGAVQELFIEDVYLRNHSIDLSKIRTVVDLGGNRGFFSVFAASFANKVVYVEANEKYKTIFLHSMRLNGFTNYSVENVFVGSGGFDAKAYETVPHKSLRQIMTDNSIDQIDFLKVDIEGSEFGLFETGDNCLGSIARLSMEVHPEFGNVHSIVNILEGAGFDVSLEQGIYLSASNRTLVQWFGPAIQLRNQIKQSTPWLILHQVFQLLEGIHRVRVTVHGKLHLLEGLKKCGAKSLVVWGTGLSALSNSPGQGLASSILRTFFERKGFAQDTLFVEDQSEQKLLQILPSWSCLQ